MTVVELNPEQEALLRSALATGRFADAGAVVDAGLQLVLEMERQRSAFTASLERARVEAERDGYFTLEDIEAMLDEDAAAAERRRGPESGRAA